jgi:DNA-binding GntR family transcriptional regulator
MDKTLVDETSDYLREAIINLKIKPGEQLNESFLIGKLGISRSPLREAFRLLEGEGLLARRSGRGVFVREITPNDVLELFPIRAALEGLAAELAGPRLTEKELQDLRKITEKMEVAIKKGDTRGSLRLNFDFHKQIVKGARNGRLEAIIKNLGRQSLWFSFAALYFRKVKDLAIRSHKDIFIALERGDGIVAAECIKNHINDGALRILESFPLKG